MNLPGVFFALMIPPYDDCKCRLCQHGGILRKKVTDFIYVGQGARHDILIEQIKEVEKKIFSPSFPI